jgi:hypothetical protein
VTEAQQAHQKICDKAQSTQVQGRNLPFSRVAIAHPVKGQPVRLEVQVPVNISFGANVKIQPGTPMPALPRRSRAVRRTAASRTLTSRTMW